MAKKLTIEFIRNEFNKESYKLLSTDYVNSKTKLDYICPNGHRHFMRWNNWQQGDRCLYCSNRVPITIDKVRYSFDKEGYTLLSTEYINSNTKLNFICPTGHHHSIKWNDWRQGCRCLYCSNRAPIHFMHVNNSFEREGYVLLSTEYRNNRTKLKFICCNGHTHNINWDSWKRGQRCFHCSGSEKLKIEYIAHNFSKEGYVLISTHYINNRTKLEYMCSNGHNHTVSWHDWVSGCRCPTCAIMKQIGPGNPSWKGGLSYEPYCPVWKDKTYKNDIKLRDGCTCQNFMCGSKEKMVIHHIDYNKKNCHPNNLITLCNRCNIKANTNREWHQAFYTELNKRRLNIKKLSNNTEV